MPRTKVQNRCRHREAWHGLGISHRRSHYAAHRLSTGSEVSMLHAVILDAAIQRDPDREDGPDASTLSAGPTRPRCGMLVHFPRRLLSKPA